VRSGDPTIGQTISRPKTTAPRKRPDLLSELLPDDKWPDLSRDVWWEDRTNDCNDGSRQKDRPFIMRGDPDFLGMRQVDRPLNRRTACRQMTRPLARPLVSGPNLRRKRRIWTEVQTNAQTSGERTEPATKTTDPDNRTDLLSRGDKRSCRQMDRPRVSGPNQRRTRRISTEGQTFSP
jgi:hypothetical protein